MCMEHKGSRIAKKKKNLQKKWKVGELTLLKLSVKLQLSYSDQNNLALV